MSDLTARERDVLGVIIRNPMISQQELAERLRASRSAVAGHVMRLTEKGVIRGRGYVLNDRSYVVVVGGANVDIEGRSSAPLAARDSSPGAVTRSPGGVARNIAHNIANLGSTTRLLTALGRDSEGAWLHDVTAAAGVDMSETVWSTRPTASYVSIVDATGELAHAVNDMSVLDDLNTAAIEARSALLNHAAMVVIDCNLSVDVIAAVAAGPGELFVDTVSAAKAERIIPHLHLVHTLKPNRLEAQVLTGIEIVDDKTLRVAAGRLLDKGVDRVIISLGADGGFLADETGMVTVPTPDAGVTSVTGAGDALMAGLVVAHLADMTSIDAVQFGLAAAAIAAASPSTVNADLNQQAVAAVLKESTP